MSATKTDFPIIALSVVMMICGLAMALATANLPLPATGQVHGIERLILGCFAAMGIGFGIGLARTGLMDRIDRWSATWFVIGTLAFAGAFVAAVVIHYTA